MLLRQVRSVSALPPPRQPSGIIPEPQRISVVIEVSSIHQGKREIHALTQNQSLRNPSPFCQLRTRGFHVDTSEELCGQSPLEDTHCSSELQHKDLFLLG